MRAGAKLWADREDSKTTCQHEKSTVTNTQVQVHNHTHTPAHTQTYAQTHSCGYEGGSWQARGQNNFLRFVMWNPTGILMTGSRDPGTMGVSCLCLTHILFIILFCSGGRKFAQAKDFSLLIISALTQDCKLCNSRTAFPLRPLQMLLIVELLQQRRSEEKFDLQK